MYKYPKNKGDTNFYPQWQTSTLSYTYKDTETSKWDPIYVDSGIGYFVLKINGKIQTSYGNNWYETKIALTSN